MAFTDLPIDVQNIISVNFELFGKLFVMGILAVYALYYLMYVHDRKSTPYMLIGIVKSVFYWLSYLYLGSLPMWVVLLFPSVSISRLLLLVLYLYAGFVVFALMWLFVQIIYYGPMYLLRMGGMTKLVPEDNKVLKRIDKMLGANSRFRGMVQRAKKSDMG